MQLRTQDPLCESCEEIQEAIGLKHFTCEVSVVHKVTLWMIHPPGDQLLCLPPCLSQSKLMESRQALLRPPRRDSLLMGPKQFSLWLSTGLVARDRRWDDFTSNARTSHSLMSRGCHLKT